MQPCWTLNTALSRSSNLSQLTKDSSKCNTHAHREAKKNTLYSLPSHQKVDRQAPHSLFSVLWTINAAQPQRLNPFKLHQRPQSGRKCHARTEHTVGPQPSNSYCKSDWMYKESRVKCPNWLQLPMLKTSRITRWHQHQGCLLKHADAAKNHLSVLFLVDCSI